MEPGGNPPIGIMLSADKSDMLVKYTLPLENKQVFCIKIYATSSKRRGITK